jgi:hypothetical protein
MSLIRSSPVSSQNSGILFSISAVGLPESWLDKLIQLSQYDLGVKLDDIRWACTSTIAINNPFFTLLS